MVYIITYNNVSGQHPSQGAFGCISGWMLLLLVILKLNSMFFRVISVTFSLLSGKRFPFQSFFSNFLTETQFGFNACIQGAKAYTLSLQMYRQTHKIDT